MPTNLQKPVAAQYAEDGSLHIHSEFPTIQGEGPFCGERALFFRLWACNLQCPGCDTEYTADKRHVTAAYMAKRAEEMGWAPGDLVVITGGEPMRQNIGPAVSQLLAAGFRVQIETNGVLAAPDLPWGNPNFFVVCSPKTSVICAEVHEHACAFKYVLRAGQVAPDGLPTVALGHRATPYVARPRPGAKVYVQPMDESDAAANALNLNAAISSAMRHGYTLQIQVHKAINME